MSIENRLKTLERRVRQLMSTIVVLIGFGALVSWTQEQRDSSDQGFIRASRIEVIDRAGDVVLRLGGTSGGGGEIEFLQRSGDLAHVRLLRIDGSSIVMSNERGAEVIRLSRVTQPQANPLENDAPSGSFELLVHDSSATMSLGSMMSGRNPQGEPFSQLGTILVSAGARGGNAESIIQMDARTIGGFGTHLLRVDGHVAQTNGHQGSLTPPIALNSWEVKASEEGPILTLRRGSDSRSFVIE